MAAAPYRKKVVPKEDKTKVLVQFAVNENIFFKDLREEERVECMHAFEKTVHPEVSEVVA